MMSAESKRELYERRKAAGVCVRCGKAPATKGKTLCQKCRDIARIENRKYHRAGRIYACVYAAGLEDLGEYACLYCPRPTCMYDKGE